MDEQDINGEIEHQKKMLRVLRNRLRQRELQEAQYGINVPPEVAIEISGLTERIRTHEAELKHLQSLAVEGEVSLAEARFRALLAQSWDTPQGRPSLTNLELLRLDLGISSIQAKKIEDQIRSSLAAEAFYKIHYDMFTYISTEIVIKIDAQNLKARGTEIGFNQDILEQLAQKFEIIATEYNDNDFGWILTLEIGIISPQLRLCRKENSSSLLDLGRAICFDPQETANLFVKSLPPYLSKTYSVSLAPLIKTLYSTCDMTVHHLPLE